MWSFNYLITQASGILGSLPPGKLPCWLLFISVVSVFNSVQTYINKELTRRVYENKPSETTGLSARTFGTWTLLSSVIRLYGAFYLYDERIFQLTFITYSIALLHFGSEWLIFRTCKLGKGFMGPLVVATASVVWMYNTKEYYTGRGW
ncbi:AaceriADL100Wp [[Ashbya] aceris (nom. inval.)]|nr:AaceriADL100Wp [[Ashbya] aceris (nom. inval.)]